jgi:hypothetical protein
MDSQSHTARYIIATSIARNVAMPAPQTKVFLSHRKRDIAQVKRLAVTLREAGFDPWFDEWRLKPGDSIVGSINQALNDARFFILCYSDDGVDSPWTGREWMSTLSRQLEQHSVTLLPARLGGSAPAILADLKAADLADDWDRGVSELLHAMR